jgi:hypothetical protein
MGRRRLLRPMLQVADIQPDGRNNGRLVHLPVFGAAS